MKSLIPVLSLFLVMITFNACKKNEEFTSSMSYKVDGVLKTMSAASAMNRSTQFGIGGYDDKESMLMEFYFPPNTNGTPAQNIKIGSYFIESAPYGLGVSYLAGPLKTPYAVTKGSVNITYKTDSRIKGTFSFTVLNADDDTEIAITDGVFDCEIKNLY